MGTRGERNKTDHCFLGLVGPETGLQMCNGRNVYKMPLGSMRWAESFTTPDVALETFTTLQVRTIKPGRDSV